jgi:hypothetical protein
MGLEMPLTNKQAVEAFENLERQYEKQISFAKKDVEIVVTAIHTSLQFRDYVMGELPNLKDTATALEFITALLPLVDEGQRAPLYTIMSGYYYETGDSELAFVSLLQAKLLDPNYSLANLFERVFKAGWGADSFPQMRAELHPKVSAELFENLELELA